MIYISIENVFKNMNGLAGSVKKSFRLHPDEFDLIAVSESLTQTFSCFTSYVMIFFNSARF